MGYCLSKYVSNPDGIQLSGEAFLMTMCLDRYEAVSTILSPSDDWTIKDACMTTVVIAACRGTAVDRCAR